MKWDLGADISSWTCLHCGFAGNLESDVGCFACRQPRNVTDAAKPQPAWQVQPTDGSGWVNLAIVGMLAVLGAAAAFAIFTPHPSARPTSTAGGNPVVAQRPSERAQASDAPGTHAVRPGESLFSIASGLGISEDQLRWWNLDLYPSLNTNPQDIAVGWVLITTGEPMPTPTPRPTARPTPPPAPAPAPPLAGGGGGGSAFVAYNPILATAYRADVELTYVNDMQYANYQYAIAGFTAPGTTPEERAARIEEAKLEVAYFIATSINEHMTFLGSKTPSTCFVDAYMADIALGQAFFNAAKYMSQHHGDDAGLLAAAFDVRDPFLTALDGYFSDC